MPRPCTTAPDDLRMRKVGTRLVVTTADESTSPGGSHVVDRRLRQRREDIESARAEGRALDGPIGESWSRCESVLSARTDAAPVELEPPEARERWEASPIRRSGVGLEEQLTRAASASDMVAAVTDEQGRILWSAGGPSMRRPAERVGFVPGGRWDEASAGTNALGLALRTRSVATVFSAEHWCDAVRDWACWSAPVIDRSGQCLGVIDLSGRWDTASPLAEITVATLGRLVSEHLPDERTADTGADRSGSAVGAGRPTGGAHGDTVDPREGWASSDASPTLRLSVLGGAGATFDGRPLRIGHRQIELLLALAVEGPCSLDRLQGLVYGDRPVSPATTKADLSHLRKQLGGAIASRPYRLTVPVEIDALQVRRHLDAGELAAASGIYRGSLLPDSEAPFATDLRHVIDVCLRESLLGDGGARELLDFAAVHPYDVQVLERAVERSGNGGAIHHEALARLDNALRT